MADELFDFKWRYKSSQSSATRWTNSELKKTFQKQGGIQIKMPELYEEMYDFIDRENLTFGKAADSSKTTFTNRSRAFRCLEEFEKELKKASGFLGMEFASKSSAEVSSNSNSSSAVSTDGSLDASSNVSTSSDPTQSVTRKKK